MSETKQDGGPAFPHSKWAAGVQVEDSSGMSLRDWFAGQALVGLLAASETDDWSPSEIMREAFDYADGMLRHRG